MFTSAQVVVHGTVVLKSPHNEEEEILLSRHLVTSLGTVPKKSWGIDKTSLKISH